MLKIEISFSYETKQGKKIVLFFLCVKDRITVLAIWIETMKWNSVKINDSFSLLGRRL